MIALFRRFRERALAEIEPRDLMAEILVRHLIYYAWDVMRLQRYKNNLLALGSERTAAVIARSAHSEAKDAPALQDRLILGEADMVMCGAFDETVLSKLKPWRASIACWRALRRARRGLCKRPSKDCGCRVPDARSP